MAKRIALGLLAVVVLFLGVVAAQPSEFSVVRAATMAAPPDVVFAQVNDFKAWEAWSPWEKLDLNQKHTYSEPSAGTGATMAWAGNDQVGEGNMKLTASQPPQHLEIALEFVKPFPSKSTVAFDLAQEGDGTKVTWTMKGSNDFMGKAFGLFVNMDKMLGADFEAGLAGIKSVSETRLAEAKQAAQAKQAEEAAAAAAAAPPTDAADAGAATPAAK